MTVNIGDKLPETSFKIMTSDGPAEMKSSDLFSGKKVVLFGLPGAFTPTCSSNHVPGYLDNLDAIKAKGVDEVAVMSVNDAFVMGAWANATGGQDKIHFLADGNAEFSKATGLDIDLAVAGFGTRCKRFSMVVDDGVMTSLNIEENPGEAVVSGAARMLEQL